MKNTYSRLYSYCWNARPLWSRVQTFLGPLCLQFRKCRQMIIFKHVYTTFNTWILAIVLVSGIYFPKRLFSTCTCTMCTIPHTMSCGGYNVLDLSISPIFLVITLNRISWNCVYNNDISVCIDLLICWNFWYLRRVKFHVLVNDYLYLWHTGRS